MIEKTTNDALEFLRMRAQDDQQIDANKNINPPNNSTPSSHSPSTSLDSGGDVMNLFDDDDY